MLRWALWVLGMGVLVAVMVAGAATASGGEEPVTVRVEETDWTPDVGFSPKALSKTTYTPIRGFVSQELRAFPHPPAERELLLELDRNVMIQTQGLPVCRVGLQTGRTVDETCKGTIVGHGEETMQVAFAEQNPIDVPAKLQIFNGGERDGAITMYVYGYFSAPISGSLITKVVFTRIHDGRFGWLADAQMPQITGGSGSVVDLDLKIGRQYSYEGKKASVLSAKCADGKLQAHFQVGFEDGTSGETTVTRACTPEG
ncbi:MAG: hypothetical protein ACRDPE_14150 [Solirubrobacterales bacterium]